ncbi:MAG: iron uptake porin [Cyanobacteria bacterium J06631_6]
MSKIFLKVAPLICAALLTGIYSNAANAQNTELLEKIEQYGQEGQNNLGQRLLRRKTTEPALTVGQVTNVNQLRDVSPTDWAYEALRSLVDRYGCISGFPNQTYRGSQPLSRYEFAAGLNSCLNQIERLIAAGDSSVGSEDLEAVARLNQEFEAELASVRGRLDEIETRTAVLEDSQFSTTTKLVGEAIFGIAGVASGTNEEFIEENGDDDIDGETVFGYRTRLELETSFDGEDLLFTRLSTGNFPEFAETTGTFQGDLAFAEPADSDLGLEVLFYTRPLGANTDIIIGAAGLAADDIANTVNVLDGDGGSGAVSAFGTRSPIYLPPGETGLGIVQRFGETLEFSAGYLAGDAANPEDEAGLFDGTYTALGQLLFTPIESLNIAFTYAHSIGQSDTGTGSDLSNIRSFATPDGQTDALGSDVFIGDIGTVSDAYSLQFSFALSDRIIIGGWGGLNAVTTLDTFEINGVTVEQGTQDIFNWAATLAFPDLFQEGSMAGIIIGFEPWVAQSSIDVEGFDEDDETSLHAEAFYEYRLNDNIAITPGLIYVTNPDNNDDNDDLLIGTIRTTFSF